MSFRLPSSVTGLAQTVTHAVTGRGGDGRYFHSTKKGEIHELKEELHSVNKERKKEAVKKVIAAMTIGKDVSGLFPDVVNCMQTTNIELKKLVYLYVINYAKVQPELAILAINTFRKDSLDTNPLIRALAVRTMGCIRLEQVVEYLVEPLRKACKDPDPYVRKTAATCICKLYETSPETVIDQGFLETLKEMLSDSNPTVVANAVASLTEMSQSSGRDYLGLNEETVAKMLTALGECSEWGQVFILDSLSTYDPPNSDAAASIIERITARLSHANAAVVLSTIRLVLRMLDLVDDAQLVRATHKKLRPPLVTLLSAESEIQYVALRNISLIVQKYPSILSNEINTFYCKYNDPHYVKMEKLEILIRLTNETNIDQVLMELKEYSTEVDVEFVRRTIRAIGRCAIKLERAAEKCVNVLLSLIETHVNYVVQETIVVIKDIFRKYPNRYESVISKLCENLESLDEPEAKASMIWIIGEYAERIDNGDELLETFMEGFHDETIIVKQQILTATVKLFLKSPSRAQDLVTRVLKLSTEESDDPDLRDRGFIYWRLLSTDPEATKRVVLSDKPVITDESFSLDTEVLERLVENISTLASVFHRVPESFVTRLRITGRPSEPSDVSDEEGHADAIEIRDAMRNADAYHSGNEEDVESSSEGSSSGPGDLLDLDEESSDRSEENGCVPKQRSSAVPPLNEWSTLLTPETSGTKGYKGIGIKGIIYNHKGRIYLHLCVVNTSTQTTITGDSWALQINKNSFGLAPHSASALGLPDLIPGQQAETSVLLDPNVNLSQTPPAHPLTLQVAIKTSLDIFYLQPVPFSVANVIADREPIDKDIFRTHWTRMGETKQASFMGSFSEEMTGEKVVSILKVYGFNLTVMRQQATFDMLYCSAVTTNNLLLLFEIAIQKPGRGVKVTFRADAPQMFAILREFSIQALKIQPR